MAENLTFKGNMLWFGLDWFSVVWFGLVFDVSVRKRGLN